MSTDATKKPPVVPSPDDTNDAHCQCLNAPSLYCPIPEHQEAARRMWDRIRQKAGHHQDRNLRRVVGGAHKGREVYRIAECGPGLAWVEDVFRPGEAWREPVENLSAAEYTLPEPKPMYDRFFKRPER